MKFVLALLLIISILFFCIGNPICDLIGILSLYITWELSEREDRLDFEKRKQKQENEKRSFISPRCIPYSWSNN
jgi:hypothetical protein